MYFSQQSSSVANQARKLIQKTTKHISEGEAAAITTWWGFINDHARCEGYDPKELARSQLEAFLEKMPVKITREH